MVPGVGNPYSKRAPLPREKRAYNQTRTGDLFLTKEVLYRLSYVGND